MKKLGIVLAMAFLNPYIMEYPHEMTTLSQVMEKLRKKKIEEEYKWTKDGFTLGNNRFYQPTDLVIVKVYRFEGMTDPGDMAVLYVIEANDGALGYSISAYGADANESVGEEYSNFIRQVPEKNHADQLLFEI